jgi:hypothetical protein
MPKQLFWDHRSDARFRSCWHPNPAQRHLPSSTVIACTKGFITFSGRTFVASPCVNGSEEPTLVSEWQIGSLQNCVLTKSRLLRIDDVHYAAGNLDDPETDLSVGHDVAVRIETTVVTFGISYIHFLTERPFIITSNLRTEVNISVAIAKVHMFCEALMGVANGCSFYSEEHPKDLAGCILGTSLLVVEDAG